MSTGTTASTWGSDEIREGLSFLGVTFVKVHAERVRSESSDASVEVEISLAPVLEVQDGEVGFVVLLASRNAVVDLEVQAVIRFGFEGEVLFRSRDLLAFADEVALREGFPYLRQGVDAVLGMVELPPMRLNLPPSATVFDGLSADAPKSLAIGDRLGGEPTSVDE